MKFILRKHIDQELEASGKEKRECIKLHQFTTAYIEKLKEAESAVDTNSPGAKNNLEEAKSIERLDSLVDERLNIIEKARSIKSDSDFKKSNQEIKLDALETSGLSRDEFKDSSGNFSTALIDGAFKVLKNNKATGIVTDPERAKEIREDSVDQKNKMSERIQNRWKLGDQQGGK